MPAAGNETVLSDTDVLIVGTGFSGLAIGTRLARQGRHSFALVDRASSVGGTWRDNTYPGAACDIPSHLYSFSFRPSTSWSHVYGRQPQILDYLERTAVEEGLLPHTFLDSEMLDAVWDEQAQRWDVRTSRGRHLATTLVTACGHLSDPAIPDLEGLDTFTGEIFHSARWNHDVDLVGKRIGVVGTGASAIQIVPELADLAESLTVFQRSAPYIVPRKDRAYSEAEKTMFGRLPETAQQLRAGLFWDSEARFPQRLGVPAFLAQMKKAARDHLAAQVADADLRDRLTPAYELGCKRILLSNTYYPALTQPHVRLETSGIARMTETGVVARDGSEIALDVLVVATGFEATDLPFAHRIRGRDGRLLSDHWAEGGRTVASTSVAGFPNLFVMQGPNTGLGAGSIVYIIESQAEYVSGAVDFIVDRESAIEPTVEAEDAYVADLDLRSQGTVWLSEGCRSWYRHPVSGRLSALWPDYMHRYRAENGAFDPAPYEILGSGRTVAAGQAR
ncbi:NAD(P)/FAD-dependent oxidoreductase [Mumia zhuanghuii]|uniref:NAD(P)/FAD-dependent oxidoreductase n=1 Tax=Mumia zhuanghuii TaxID=2585211 RepID=A0A5Q6RKF3_9ACTN|nr:NAD(P)/FAD-dependent oxidoreductase [Mumia zhuanghuii]